MFRISIKTIPSRPGSLASVCGPFTVIAALALHIIGAQAAEPQELPISDGKVFSLAFSADGKHLAVGTTSATAAVKVFHLASKKEVLTIPCPGRGAGFSVAFSPDSKVIAVADFDLNVKIHNLSDGTEVASLPGDPDRKKYRQARRILFTSDGQRLVVGYSTGEVFVWDVTNKKVAAKFDHKNEINALAVSADGKQIATGTTFGLRVWDAADGKPLVALDQKSSGEHEIQVLAFTPDGKSLIAGDSPGFVRILATSDGKELNSTKMASVGGSTTVAGLAVTTNGKSIVLPGLVSGLDPQRPRALNEGLIIMDLATARSQSFLSTTAARLFALSPNDKIAAIASGESGDSVLLHDLTAAQPLKAVPK